MLLLQFICVTFRSGTKLREGCVQRQVCRETLSYTSVREVLACGFLTGLGLTEEILKRSTEGWSCAGWQIRMFGLDRPRLWFCALLFISLEPNVVLLREGLADGNLFSPKGM